MAYTILFIFISLIYFWYKGRTSVFDDSVKYTDLNLPQVTKSQFVRKIEYTPTALVSRKAKETYLHSKAWKELKLQRLAIANNCCEHCHSTTDLHLHHINYANLQNESIDDVCILCSTCHNTLHNFTGKDRLTIHHPNVLRLLDLIQQGAPNDKANTTAKKQGCFYRVQK